MVERESAVEPAHSKGTVMEEVAGGWFVPPDRGASTPEGSKTS